MAQTRKRRSRKHRGTAAGTIEKAAHNRSARKATGKPSPQASRQARLNRPPSWRSAANKAGIASIVFGVLLLLVFKRPVAEVLLWTVLVFFFYTPLGFWTDRAVYNRRMRTKAKKAGR
jgi:uncharacterized membrane protein YphA (DoxX/SURF4 family)